VSVTQVKQGVGAWNVRLRGVIPGSVIKALDAFGHIAIIPGSVSVVEYGDNLLAAARYVGVYRTKAANLDGTVLSGVGMEAWLGDEQNNGDVFEDPVELDTANFGTVIAALLPPGGSITLGTIGSVPGTYTGRHQWVTPRKALDYVTSVFGAEWRVNNDGTLDAGLVADLYVTTPRAMLVSKADANDLRYRSLPGQATMTQDNSNYTTRVVVLGEGDADAIVTGSADTVVNPYKDIHGNPVVVTRLVSESFTSEDNIGVRADVVLAQYATTSPTVALSTSKYDIKGDAVVGDYIYVFDRDRGFYDDANQEIWQGDPINPVALRVVELSWPIRDGWTVAFRDADGVWIDLTPYVFFESGDTSVVVGDRPASVQTGISEPIGSRPSVDTSIPDSPAFTGSNFGSYQSDSTNTTKAAIRLTWSTPLNMDGSTIVDGDHYEIRYRVTAVLGYQVKWGVIGIPSLSPYKWGELLGNPWGAPVSDPVEDDPKWYQAVTAWGTNDATILELTPGVTYEFQIRAVDRSGHLGPFSGSSFFTTIGDLFAPSNPAPPIVASSRIAIQVIHTLGKASGGTFNLEPDLDHLEIHVGGSDSFYTDDSTMVGKLPANAAMLSANIQAVGTFPVEQTDQIHVKVRAVDRAGNKSGASTAATVTAELIDNAHISDLSVDKLTAGTIAANLILAANIDVGTGGSVTLNEGALRVKDGSGRVIIEMGKRTTDTFGGYGLTVFDPSAGTNVPAIRIGQINDPNSSYGMEVVNVLGKLVTLSTLAFGIQAATAFPGATVTRLDSFADLPGQAPGPTVDVVVGNSGRCILIWGALMQQFSTNPSYGGSISFQVTGATSLSPSNDRMLTFGQSDNGISSGGSFSNNLSFKADTSYLLTGLNPGLHHITLKYQVDASHPGTSEVYWSNCTLIAIPY
jgi:hypothetical protein